MRLKWTEDNIKFEFSMVSRVTIDCPEGYSKGCDVNRRRSHQRWRRQQRECGIMIWAGIIGCIIVSPWKVSDGIKMTANAFLRDHLELLVTKAKDHIQDDNQV